MKATLRIAKLEARKDQNPAQKCLNDEKIVKKISALKLYKQAKKILFYLPLHREVNLISLFEENHTKKTFVLPRIKGKNLELYIITNLKHTEKGKFNIPEPIKNLPKIKPGAVDLLLIPGVVFAENGNRIGYGKGFYDRLLKKITCPKIGIAYEFQIVKNIAGEAHDIQMDMIITEKRTLKVF